MMRRVALDRRYIETWTPLLDLRLMALTLVRLPFDDRGNVVRDDAYATSESGVFVAGDAGRGQSLIVWAIAEGRAVAAAVDRFLEGETQLPAPVRPTDRGIGL